MDKNDGYIYTHAFPVVKGEEIYIYITLLGVMSEK